MYIWGLEDWPNFRWDETLLREPLVTAHRKLGWLLGSMSRLGFDLKLSAELEAITHDALTSSEIEGEFLDPKSVRSSVARRLGVDEGSATKHREEGIVTVTMDATKNPNDPLTPDRLFGWHAALFTTGYSGMHKITVGNWRDDADGPMQVVSGRQGREKIHFEAPPAKRLSNEITAFLKWFESPRTIDPILHAAIAHLWFVTIHPLDDSNGRIARALMDMSLSRSEGTPHRFYSLSGAIRRDLDRYYDTIEDAQKGDLDITEHLMWFIACYTDAINHAQKTCDKILNKAGFWERHANKTFNERHRKVLSRLLEGFEGNLTAKKWAALTKTSLPTAQRDIKELTDWGVLVRNEGGSKNTSYRLCDHNDRD